jgi:hypothetical protein
MSIDLPQNCKQDFIGFLLRLMACLFGSAGAFYFMRKSSHIPGILFGTISLSLLVLSIVYTVAIFFTIQIRRDSKP